MKISMNQIVKTIILYTLFMNTVIAEFGAPTTISYINDLMLIVLFFYLWKRKFWSYFTDINFNSINICFVGFFLISVIGLVINLVPLPLMVWGFRNTYRGIIMFIACVVYLDVYDVKKILKLFVKLQYVNFVIALYQFYFLGLYQDRLGGLFGHGNGNALCIFCVIVSSYALLEYLDGNGGLIDTIFCYGSSMIMATLAEEKLLYVELAISIVLALLICRRKLYKYIMIPIFMLSIPYILDVLTLYAPETVDMFKSSENITDYLTASWRGSYYIPRVGAIKYISENIFNGDWLKILFGLGLGNCESSNFAFLVSDFYKEYGFMNYRWIFGQWTTLEIGVLGLSAFIIFFFLIIMYTLKNRRIYGLDQNSVIGVSIITSIVCLITMMFNNTLKVDTAYIVYFTVAAGIICVKCTKEGM